MSPDILSRFQPSTADPVFRIVFLGAKDDIVNPERTAEFFEGKARIVWLPEAGHRLQDMQPLLQALRECLSATDTA